MSTTETYTCRVCGDHIVAAIVTHTPKDGKGEKV